MSKSKSPKVFLKFLIINACITGIAIYIRIILLTIYSFFDVNHVKTEAEAERITAYKILRETESNLRKQLPSNFRCIRILKVNTLYVAFLVTNDR